LPDFSIENELKDLPEGIQYRSFFWKHLNPVQAKRAMIYAGSRDWEPETKTYLIPEDDIQQFMDCDLWLIISDRLEHPLLPIRPYVLMVYDYLQRYEAVLGISDQAFLEAARLAKAVMVTSRFTQQDALQYAGLHPKKVHKLPLLAPIYEALDFPKDALGAAYFIWPSNQAVHKNHSNAALALKIYYEELDGKLECHVTGVDTDKLLSNTLQHLKSFAEMIERSQLLKKSLKLLGELPKRDYLKTLNNAAFLWHPCRVDNGTFSVIEAAHFKLSSLSSDYPAMQEINDQFQLSLKWMNADDPMDMARQLKWMELHREEQKALLPSREALEGQYHQGHAIQYWEVVRQCL
jgi:glycosyltransferase involved in cell wall biosynthesis